MEAIKEKKPLRWLRLDNAAKIYPAARRRNWSNIFRLSVTLKENVDVAVLQEALDATVPRFPSIAARLRRGVFWYYLEQIEKAPRVREEYSYPLTKMNRREIRQCAFRVIVFHKRIAVEFFHSLTDGTGGMIFLKSLTAEYLRRRYSVSIPCEKGVLDVTREPREEELEDSFQKYAGPLNASRKENNAWHLSGTLEPEGFAHVTCLELSTPQVKCLAKEYGVTVTTLMGAVMIGALQNMQKELVPNRNHRKPIRVLLPVNLRNLFPSSTLRNFALYTTPEIIPRLGDYSIREICEIVRHCMGAEITPKQMSMKIAVNVSSERMLAVKLMPLFIKNIVMKAVFNAVGEKKSCLSLSNLGLIRFPEEMEEYIHGVDFVLGVQATSPYNCGIVSYGDKMRISFIRNVKEPLLESHFYRVLRELGLHVKAQSNE